MRINVFVAQASGLSRRAADQAITEGRVQINNQPAQLGQAVAPADIITLDNQQLRPGDHTTIILNKPVGYVVSRDGQGSQTIYDLLPTKYHHLKPIGRLDKDSSGLLLLTSNGQLANRLTHPSYNKQKVYEIELDKPLAEIDAKQIEHGVNLEDGPSHLQIKKHQEKHLTITMNEGRNRQIRRTFAALGYTVTKLHRAQFGEYHLPASLESGQHDVSIYTN